MKTWAWGLGAVAVVTALAGAMWWGYWLGQPGGWFAHTSEAEQAALAARAAWASAAVAPFAVLLSALAVLLSAVSVLFQRQHLNAALDAMKEQAEAQRKANEIAYEIGGRSTGR